MNITELDNYRLSDSVKFHDRLNPRLWDENEHLRSEVKNKLLEIAEDFQEFLGVPNLDVKDITVSGSNAAYNYTPNSDIDLHLVVDLPEADRSEVFRELFDAKKYQYNDMHNIKIGEYDVELYVQDPNQEHHSQGIYSLLKNNWISVPKRRKPEIDDVSVRSKAEDLAARIDDAVKSNDYQRIAELHKKIKTMRQSGLEQQGEHGSDNLAFKVLRNQGYIKKLIDARNAARDAELSLQERKKKKKKKVRYGFGGYWYPGFGFGSEGDAGGDGGGGESMREDDTGMAQGSTIGDAGAQSTWDGVSPDTQEFLSEQEDQQEIVQAFIEDTAEKLGIDTLPKIFLHANPAWSQDNKSFGKYVPDTHELHVSLSDRHLLDVLRTTAHELAHCAQHQTRELPDNAGDTGSPWENEAHAVAGMVMRDFADEHPELFMHREINEGIMSRAGAAAALAAAIAMTPAQAQDYLPQDQQQQVQQQGQLNPIQVLNVARTLYRLKHNVTRAGAEEELNQEFKNYLRAIQGDPGAQNQSRVWQIQQRRQQAQQPQEPWTGNQYQREGVQESSGYIPTEKQKNDPRFSMALTKDIRPGQTGKEANKMALKTDSQGKPALLMKTANLRENKIKLSTDPNWYGAEVGDYKATGPVVNISANQLVGFEPDDKMNQPKSKANVGKIVAGLKKGDKLPPLLVRKYKNGYQVLDGHHRFWAYKLLGVKEIPAQIVPAKDIEELKEERMPQPSQGSGKYRDLNKALGPETPPTMPAGTLRVDVSDVYDWYKLGQHIANMKGLGHHDFGAGPPSTIVSFGDEDTEHKFIKDLEATGLDVTDIDPKDPKQPAGMRKIKTDPTYNVDEDIVESLRQEFALLEDEYISEIKMSTANLRQLAAQTGALAGMEFEMIVPNVETDVEPEYEPDWDQDQRSRSFGDVRDFFYDGDYNSRRDADRLIEELDAEYQEWKQDQIAEAWERDGADYVRDYVANNDLFDRDEAMAEARDEIIDANPDLPQESEEFTELLSARLNEMETEFADSEYEARGNIHDAAFEAFTDEQDEEYDERSFLDDKYPYMQDIQSNFDISWPYYYDVNDGQDGELDIDQVADDFSDAVGMPVNASRSYHGARREAGHYVVEPDGSLEGDNPGDGGLEFVSPPMPIDQMLNDLDAVKKWAKRRGCYTNDSTGLHINISVPDYSLDKLDYVKLALLMGDEYVLDLFGRSGNHYAKAATGKIRDALRKNPDLAPALMDKMRDHMEDLATKAIHSGVTDKYTSINTKSGYIEFRSPGGDWLDANFDKIENTLLRFTVALSAAIDPQAYRQEYLKKLYKLLEGAQDKGGVDVVQLFSNYSAGELDKAALIRQVREKQLARDLAKGRTQPGQKFWWKVTNPANTMASIEVVAAGPEEAKAKAVEPDNYPDWARVQNTLRATPLRPYQEPEKKPEQTGNWGIWIRSANRFARAPGQSDNSVLRRFPGRDSALQWIEQTRRERPDLRTDIEVREIEPSTVTTSEPAAGGSPAYTMRRPAEPAADNWSQDFERRMQGGDPGSLIDQGIAASGSFTGNWLVQDENGRTIYRFGGIGNSQSDANRVAIRWLQQNPQHMQAGVTVVPEMG